MNTKEKLVPELRFPEFTDEWEEKKLGEISSVSQGLQIPIRNRFKTKAKDRYFYITNEFLKKDSKTKYYIEKPSDSVICNENDILMTRTGNTGIVVTNVKGAFHNNFFKIKYNEDIVLKDFLVLSLRTYKTQKDIAIKSSGSTIPDLNHSDFYKIKIEIPSIKEQRKLVVFEKLLDKKLELQRKRIKELKTYKKGIMQRIFNQEIRFKDENGNEYPEWEEKKLGEIADINYGYTPSTKDNENFGGNHIWFGVTDLNNKKIKKSNRTLTDKAYRKDKLVKKGTLLMSFKLTIGELAITEVDCFTNEAIANFVWKTMINTEFMYYRLKMANIKKYGNQAAQGITLNSKSLNSIEINIPYFPEQEKIANFLSAIDKKIELEEEKLKEYEKYKKGLMQRMFI